jgi:hypothetical protein
MLEKGMYNYKGGGSYGSSSRFGLRCGQMRPRDTKVGHNNGWYNQNGEKLGWGDLSKEDLINIAKGLEEDEVFITLGEQDSYWYVDNKEKEMNPGRDYVIEKARHIIRPNLIEHANCYKERDDEEWDGVKVIFTLEKDDGAESEVTSN